MGLSHRHSRSRCDPHRTDKPGSSAPIPGNGICVQPFIIPGITHIVEMIIYSITPERGAAPVFGSFLIFPQLSSHNNKVTSSGTRMPLSIIVLHFFGQRPELWVFRKAEFLRHIRDDLALVLYNSFQQGDIGPHGHRHITISTHSDGDDAFTRIHIFNSFFQNAFSTTSLLS